MSMYKNFIKMPMFLRISTVFLMVCIIEGVATAWDEKDFIIGALQATASSLLYWLSIFLSFGISIYCGVKVADKSKSNLLGWLVGFGLFIIIGGFGGLLIRDIPGIGWRYGLLMDNR